MDICPVGTGTSRYGPHLLSPQLLSLACVCAVCCPLTACQVDKVDGGSGDSQRRPLPGRWLLRLQVLRAAGVCVSTTAGCEASLRVVKVDGANALLLSHADSTCWQPPYSLLHSSPAGVLLSGLLSMYRRTMAWLRLLLSFILVARVCR